jgi:hypothetical protein
LRQGSATAYVTGVTTGSFGSQQYDYQWLQPITDTIVPSPVFNPANLVAGMYTLTVKDANNCTAVDSVLLVQPPQLNVNVTVIGNNSCNQTNGAATALVSGGVQTSLSYLWTDSINQVISANPSISSLASGIYTVKVTDANGCIDSALANIGSISAPLLTLVSSQNITCYGLNNGSADVTVIGGATPYATQSWLLPGSLSVNPDQTGNNLWPGDNIYVVVDALGCIDSITVTIAEPPRLEVDIPLASATDVTCYNYNNGSAVMVATGGTLPYLYSWNYGSQVNDTAVGLPVGSYICTVIDDNGCTKLDSVRINQPPSFTIRTDTIINIRCFGQSNGGIGVTLFGGNPAPPPSPYTYTWNPPQSNSPIINGLSMGTYSLTVTDSRGCVVTEQFEVRQPDPFVVISSTTPSTCSQANASITINVTGATGPYTFLWNDPNQQTTNIATGLIAPASYNCLITDSKGCTETFTASTTDVPAAVIDSIISDPVDCNGGQNGSLTVYVQPNPLNGSITYQWFNSSNVVIGNGSFQGGLPEGIYTVVIINGNECITTATASVTQPFPLAITVSQNQTACNGQTLGIYASAGNGTPPYSYTWSGAGTGLNGPGIHNVLFTNTTTTSDVQLFNVTATDANNCPAVSGQFFVTVLPKISIVASDNNACFGQNVTLSALASGGDGAPYEFFWATSPPQTQTGSSSTISIPVLRDRKSVV